MPMVLALEVGEALDVGLGIERPVRRIGGRREGPIAATALDRRHQRLGLRGGHLVAAGNQKLDCLRGRLEHRRCRLEALLLEKPLSSTTLPIQWIALAGT